MQEPLPLHEGHGLQVGEVARVLFQQEFVVIDRGSDKGNGLGLIPLRLCGEVEPLPQFLAGVGPMDDLLDPDEPADHPAALRDGIACFRVDPPLDKLGNPAVRIGVA